MLYTLGLVFPNVNVFHDHGNSVKTEKPTSYLTLNWSPDFIWISLVFFHKCLLSVLGSHPQDSVHLVIRPPEIPWAMSFSVFPFQDSQFWGVLVRYFVECHSQFSCYDVKVHVPPKFICWSLNPRRDDIGKWGLWEVTRSWGLMHLWKRPSRELPGPDHLVKERHEICDPEEGAHPAILASWYWTSSPFYGFGEK